LVARWVASLGEVGLVSIFEVADRLYVAVASLATIGVGNVVLVYLSRLDAAEDRWAWRWILVTAFGWSALWLVIALALWMALPGVSELIPFRSSEALAEVRLTFLVLSIGLPAFIMKLVFSRRILTLGLARRLVPMAIAGLLFSGLAGWLLLEPLGTPGIATGVVGGHYLVTVLMLFTLNSHGPPTYPRPC
jgi:peptidoglycan biosynthesis protein MviN/MurJ (putative lipid II flippase)